MEIRKGFTLVEFLIYIAILSVVLPAIILFMSFVIRSRVKAQIVSDIEVQGAQVIAIVLQAVRNADSISVPVAQAGGASLTLAMTDVSKNPTIIDLSGGRLQIKEGSGAAVSITTANVTVGSLSFINMSRASTPGDVRFSFSLTRSNPSNVKDYDYSRTFYSSASLR